MTGNAWSARGEPELPAGTGWLSAAERERLSGMRFTKRRTEYLLRRWAAKDAVMAAFDLPREAPAEVEILNRPSGAPYVLLRGRPFAARIAVTDRAGWAVCLVGPRDERSGPIGVDLELVEPRSAGFITDFLTEAEQEYVAAQPDPQSRQVAANLLWSAKESALKVLQVGLRMDTRMVQVEVRQEPAGDGWAPLRIAGPDEQRFPGWWRRDGRFLLTVAAAAAAPPPVRLPGSADLAAAEPLQSWLADPVSDPSPRPG